jgi:tetratricopeptide (TPR) repeat protein
MPTRSQQLEKMLEREPNDPFLLYGLALEHKKSSDFPRAIQLLHRTIEVDPGYCYAYYQLGQIHAANGDVATAKRVFEQGIAAATKKGDAHAAGEISAALAEL